MSITTSGGTYTSGSTFFYGPILFQSFTPLILNGNFTSTVNTTGLGVLTTYDITAEGGATTTVDEGIGALAVYDLTANGGDITATTGISVGSTNNVLIENGGSFTAGASFLTLLNGLTTPSTIDFGSGTGNTFHITADTGIGLLNGTPTIDGFTTIGADTIVDDQIATAGLDGYTITNNGGTQVLTFYDGTTAEGSLTFGTGTFVAGSYTLANGPLDIDTTSGSLEFSRCFLTGTHIQTPTGEAMVETLKIGDKILAADGSVRSVRWLGINTIATRFPDPLRFMPVRIRAGALGENLPIRDLLVSPDHAMFVDGVLIHAGALVNGLTIVRELKMPETFAYYHVEVEDHALIVSEGAASESFVDNADRMAFDNWAEHVALYGDEVSIPEMDYPRAQSARQVPTAIRARLTERADHMVGWSLAQAA